MPHRFQGFVVVFVSRATTHSNKYGSPPSPLPPPRPALFALLERGETRLSPPPLGSFFRLRSLPPYEGWVGDEIKRRINSASHSTHPPAWPRGEVGASFRPASPCRYPRNLKGFRHILKCSKRGLPRSHPTSGALLQHTATTYVGGWSPGERRGWPPFRFAPCSRSLRTHSLLFRFLLDKHRTNASSSSSSSSPSFQVYLFVFQLSPCTLLLRSSV